MFKAKIEKNMKTIQKAELWDKAVRPDTHESGVLEGGEGRSEYAKKR